MSERARKLQLRIVRERRRAREKEAERAQRRAREIQASWEFERVMAMLKRGPIMGVTLY